MTHYEKTERPTFSGLKSQKGYFYHQSGDYGITLDDGKSVVPINRSYSPFVNGGRSSKFEAELYRKDLVVHERAEEKVLVDEELLVDIYGKPLLFIDSKSIAAEFNPANIDDDRVSPQARKLITETRDLLLRAGFAFDYQLGVFGSHRVGLNGVDSDMDLIAWVSPEFRRAFLDEITHQWEAKGYKTSSELVRNDEDALRYAKRFGVSISAGYYLAEKRTRFMTPEGVSVSLQVLCPEVESETVRGILSGIEGEWEQEDFLGNIEIIDSNMSFNFPKIWQVSNGGLMMPVISFSWMHQGMGCDGGIYGSKYQLKASLVHSEGGDFFYLRDTGHYILPSKLLR